MISFYMIYTLGMKCVSIVKTCRGRYTYFQIFVYELQSTKCGKDVWKKIAASVASDVTSYKKATNIANTYARRAGYIFQSNVRHNSEPDRSL